MQGGHEDQAGAGEQVRGDRGEGLLRDLPLCTVAGTDSSQGLVETTCLGPEGAWRQTHPREWQVHCGRGSGWALLLRLPADGS